MKITALNGYLRLSFSRLFSVSICALCLIVTLDAWGSGFVVARFGGEHGHPTTNNLSAIYYNPGALSLGTGTRLMIDGTLAHRSVDYTRPEGAISSPGVGTPNDIIGANSGTATLRNFAGSPFIALASDFGVPKLTVAFGLYVPFGGGASWDENDSITPDQSARYPGAVDGQQRWWSIDSTLKAIYITLAASYKVSDQLHIGISVNRVSTSIDTIRARTVPAPETDDVVGPVGLVEGRSYLSASATDYSVGFGLVYKPTQALRFGYSYQTQPGFGEMRLKGELKITDHIAQRDPADSALLMSLPDIHRLGMQYGQKRKWQMRLFADYVRWSLFDRQCLINNPDGECDDESTTLNIERNWQDAFGVRLGGSYWVSDPVELYMGLGYDANAATDRGVDPSLFDMDKFSVALGARLSLLKNAMRLGLTFTQVIYMTRDIDVVKTEAGKPYNGYPGSSGGPSPAGTYEQSVSVANLYLEYMF